MDNQTRSEISRRKAVDAALMIVAREGVSALTFDALSRESGISKGGLLHQFKNRQGVLRALLVHQRERFAEIASDYLAKEGASKAEPKLAALIAIYRESVNQPHSVARAGLAVFLDNPTMFEDMKETDVTNVKALQDEANDPDLSLLRYFAASGLALHTLLRMPGLDESTRSRLFDRLNDEAYWRGLESNRKSVKVGKTKTE